MSPRAASRSSASGADPLSRVAGVQTRCQTCGVSGRVGAKFCAKCGSSFSDQGHDRVRHGETPPTGVLEVCPGCGAQVTGSSVVCSACGLTLDLVEDEDGNIFPPAPNQEEDASEEESPEKDTSPSSTSPDSLDGSCLACGAPLDDDACSCPSCGLSYGARSEDRDGAGLEQEREIAPLCPWCGIPTDAERGGCPQCGRSLSIAPNPD
jgi:predicted amidophosphoribosyltransferase